MSHRIQKEYMNKIDLGFYGRKRWSDVPSMITEFKGNWNILYSGSLFLFLGGEHGITEKKKSDL